MADITAKALIPETFQGARDDIAGQIGLIWELIKAPLIVPVLQLAVYICLTMSLMLFVERLYMGIVIILVKLFWKKPDKRYNWEPFREDLEIGNSAFPVVLIQIPMYNEREVSLSRSLCSCYEVFDLALLIFLNLGSWVYE
ncbi:hypothetical protein CsSME_00040545 [Camellia sinensis var. sinensis]